MWLTDLFEEIEHAENDQEDIFHCNGHGIDGRFLGSEIFKYRVHHKNGGCDQDNLSKGAFGEIEKDERREAEVFKDSEQAQHQVDQKRIGGIVAHFSHHYAVHESVGAIK